ncbi:MAG: phosphatidate cytidylyltransferase [Hyphomicrobiaceae bacterium]
MIESPFIGWLASWGGLTANTLVVLVAVVILLGVATLAAAYLSRERADAGESELELRVRSWWVIVALIIGALLVGRTMALVLFAFISFLALKEYLSIIPTRRADRAVLFFAYATIPLQFWLIATEQYGIFIVLVPVWMFVALPSTMVLLGETDGFLKAVGTLHWGVMSTVYSLGHLAYLLVLPKETAGIAEGAALVVTLLILTELNDVAQYVWGKTFGRHKIIPKVSPGKTWEGFLGGMATTLVVSALLISFLLPQLSTSGALTIDWWLYVALIGLAISLGGFFGDLSVSAVKRDLGIKDSGALIPGHGGILDRVDSLIFTAPLFFHITRYFAAGYW